MAAERRRLLRGPSAGARARRGGEGWHKPGTKPGTNTPVQNPARPPAQVVAISATLLPVFLKMRRMQERTAGGGPDGGCALYPFYTNAPSDTCAVRCGARGAEGPAVSVWAGKKSVGGPPRRRYVGAAGADWVRPPAGPDGEEAARTRNPKTAPGSG